jgi:hypothetical protein
MRETVWERECKREQEEQKENQSNALNNALNKSDWSSGLIRASGVRGLGFNFRIAPFLIIESILTVFHWFWFLINWEFDRSNRQTYPQKIENRREWQFWIMRKRQTKEDKEKHKEK